MKGYSFPISHVNMHQTLSKKKNNQNGVSLLHK